MVSLCVCVSERKSEHMCVCVHKLQVINYNLFQHTTQ